MLFKLSNSRSGRNTHCGVLEFVADEGKIYLPYWVSGHNINLLLTERKGRTGEYWPEVVAVRTERSEVRTKMTKGQYSPVWLEQARLVSSLLYGTRVMLVSKLPAFKNKKYTSYDHFHGNGPYGKIPTKKEPIRTPGFTPRLPCHIIRYLINHIHVSVHLNTTDKLVYAFSFYMWNCIVNCTKRKEKKVTFN